MSAISKMLVLARVWWVRMENILGQDASSGCEDLC